MKKLPLWILLWLALECSVFYMVAQILGFGMALLFLLIPMAIGILLLSRQNLMAFKNPTAMMMQTDPRKIFSMIGNTLVAILFIFPGFISSVLALVMWIPKVQKWCANRLLAKAMQSGMGMGFAKPKNKKSTSTKAPLDSEAAPEATASNDDSPGTIIEGEVIEKDKSDT